MSVKGSWLCVILAAVGWAVAIGMVCLQVASGFGGAFVWRYDPAAFRQTVGLVGVGGLVASAIFGVLAAWRGSGASRYVGGVLAGVAILAVLTLAFNAIVNSAS